MGRIPGNSGTPASFHSSFTPPPNARLSSGSNDRTQVRMLQLGSEIISSAEAVLEKTVVEVVANLVGLFEKELVFHLRKQECSRLHIEFDADFGASSKCLLDIIAIKDAEAAAQIGSPLPAAEMVIGIN